MIFCSISFRGYSLYWEYGNYFPRWSQWMFWGLIIYVSSCNSQQIPVNTGLRMKAWIHHFPELLARMTWVWGEHIHILSFICGREICAGFLNLTWPLTTSDSFVFSSARELQRWNIHFSSSFFFFFFTSRIQNLLQPLAHDLSLCTLYLGPLTAVADTEWHGLDNIRLQSWLWLADLHVTQHVLCFWYAGSKQFAMTTTHKHFYN